MSLLPETWPRLVADIGGTNARFALETAPQQLAQIEVLACADAFDGAAAFFLLVFAFLGNENAKEHNALALLSGNLCPVVWVC